MLRDQLRLLIQPCLCSLQNITVYIRTPLSQSSENQLSMPVSNGSIVRFYNRLFIISLDFCTLLGWFARDPCILHRVGVLLPAAAGVLKQTRQIVFADDCFQLLKVSNQKTVHAIKNAVQALRGCKS